MRTRRSDSWDLLGWYPPSWRERYGEELKALMEDTLGDRPPSPRFRLSIAWAGLRERGHEAGVIGKTAPPANRLRAGSLMVLCAWAAFVVAGSSFAKLSEGFGQAVPAGTRTLPTVAYGVVFAAGVIGGLLVVAGLVIGLPAFYRFLQAGRWRSIRGHVLRAAAASVAGLLAVGVLIGLARTLTPAQRNGALLYHPVVWYYLLAFVPTMVLVVAALVLWTVTVVAVARQLDLGRQILSAEGVLAAAVTVAMVLMLAATAVWWGSIASSAPWILQGVRAGSIASAFDPQLVGTMVLMVLASALATYGASRVARSWRVLRSA